MVRRRRVSKKRFYGKKQELVLPVRSPFFEFMRKNLFYLIAGSVLVLFLIIGFSIWKYIANKKEEKASLLFYQAYKVYQKAIKEEKTMEDSLKLFQTLVQDYSGTNEEVLSWFYLGNCQFALKKFDDAIISYNNFLEKISPQTQLALLAYDSLGYCYEEKGDFKKAIENFEKTIDPSPGLGEIGYLNLARCYEALGDKENSLKIYKKFLFEYPNSQKIEFVREKIRVLELKSKGKVSKP